MKTKNRRVVLDVNVWISIFGKNDFRVVRSFVARKTTILRSQELESELLRVMGYKKFKWQKPKEFYYKFLCDFTEFHPTVPIFTDCSDPNDNYLFDLAIQAKADYLVSGDGDVLEVKINPPPQIISYTQFKELFC